MPSNYEKSISYTLRLLSKKRYTAFEITEKLKRFLQKQEATESEEKETTDLVIKRLKELKYIDDEQYAKDFCSDRTKFKPSGKFLLKHELKKRGISKETIEKTTEGIEIEECVIAQDALERKSKQWKTDSKNKMKEKAVRFLASRGFSTDAIYKTINSCYDKDGFNE